MIVKLAKNPSIEFYALRSKKYKLLSLVVTLDASNIDFQTCCSYQLYAFKICFSIIRMQTAGFKILLFYLDF